VLDENRNGYTPLPTNILMATMMNGGADYQITVPDIEGYACREILVWYAHFSYGKLKDFHEYPRVIDILENILSATISYVDDDLLEMILFIGYSSALFYAWVRGFTGLSRVSLVIQMSSAGFPHSCVYTLRSVLEIMSFHQTSLLFFQCAILIPIAVGFYVRLNSTILK